MTAPGMVDDLQADGRSDLRTPDADKVDSAASDVPAAVIHAESVCKSYRRGASCNPVLQGVDFHVPPGQCVFLVGPSGSGKSTLLSILGCVLTPDSGRVQVLGHDVGGLDVATRTSLRLRRIGFVFQRFHLIRGLNALDNVALPLTLQGLPAREARDRARQLLHEVQLDEHRHADPRSMSGGQCQRVALARALVTEPDLILADEPTAALDAATGQEALSLMRRLIDRRGATAVVVTHDARIYGFADRILHLEGGRLVRTTVGAPGSSGDTTVTESRPGGQEAS